MFQFHEFQFKFKGLTNLKIIWLWSNKLSALHPKMFSHLDYLNTLSLSDNTCIDKDFWNNPSKTEIQEDLAICGTGYLLHDQ
jgi:hypothetical protein